MGAGGRRTGLTGESETEPGTAGRPQLWGRRNGQSARRTGGVGTRWPWACPAEVSSLCPRKNVEQRAEGGQGVGLSSALCRPKPSSGSCGPWRPHLGSPSRGVHSVATFQALGGPVLEGQRPGGFDGVKAELRSLRWRDPSLARSGREAWGGRLGGFQCGSLGLQSPEGDTPWGPSPDPPRLLA